MSAVAALTIPADAKALSHIVSGLQSITTLLTKVASFTFLTLAVDAGADRIERQHCIAAITQENLVD